MIRFGWRVIAVLVALSSSLGIFRAPNWRADGVVDGVVDGDAVVGAVCLGLDCRSHGPPIECSAVGDISGDDRFRWGVLRARVLVDRGGDGHV